MEVGETHVQYILFKNSKFCVQFVIMFTFQNEAYKSEFSNALEQSIFTAEDYMHKKAFDKSTDHEEYFAEDIGTGKERTNEITF